MKEKTNLTAKELAAKGYRRTSNRFGLISRVDRPDWKEFCAENRHPIDADWYRRCLSKDTLEVGASKAKNIPTSVHDQTGYVE